MPLRKDLLRFLFCTIVSMAISVSTIDNAIFYGDAFSWTATTGGSRTYISEKRRVRPGGVASAVESSFPRHTGHAVSSFSRRTTPLLKQSPSSENGSNATTTTTTTTPTETVAAVGFWNRLESVLFGSLTESAGEAKTKHYNDDDDPRLVLARFDNLWEGTAGDGVRKPAADAPFILPPAPEKVANSLTNFLETWAKATLHDDKGLTTPVSGTKFREPRQKSTREKDLLFAKSMKLVFRPPKRYLSYKEQKDMEKGVLPDRKGAKVDAWSPGGIELTVTITSAPASAATSPADRNLVLGLTARRCDIDGDTVIKKTTERAIVRRLENALRIWKKSNDARNQ